jgi:hypothetical protein
VVGHTWCIESTRAGDRLGWWASPLASNGVEGESADGANRPGQELGANGDVDLTTRRKTPTTTVAQSVDLEGVPEDVFELYADARRSP